MEYLTGKIQGVLFNNKNNGFCVLKVKPDKGNLLRLCGTFPEVKLEAGLCVKASGKYETHATYGLQFTASTLEVIPEPGRKGIINYISTNINSIGLITASKLYDYFGEDLVNILNKSIHRLNECQFLTARQIDTITKEWNEVNESRNASLFLSELGLTGHQIKSAYTKYGSETRIKINENPYNLCNCPGIGFVTSDNAARKLNISVDDPKRVKAVIKYSIEELVRSDGHMFVHSNQVINHINSRLFKKSGIEHFSHGDFISESQYYSNLKSLIDSGDIISHNNCLYIPEGWKHEDSIAKIISNRLTKPPFPFKSINEFISKYEKTRNITLSDDQKRALNLLNDSKFITISGYPGTGKTTLISAFVTLFDQYNLDYNLLSPTGIAAKRLSQVTGKLATTIHRTLGYKKDGTWEFHSGNKFHTDAIIVDEMSMVDSSTFFHLLDAISSESIVVLVGDSAQLPSVGPGYILNNLLSNPDVPQVSLHHIFRQGKTSDIIQIAHSILNNDIIDTSHNPESEFLFFRLTDNEIINEVCKLTSKLKEMGRNFQVISPMHEGILGVNNLNQELRDILNPRSLLKTTNFIKSGETGLYEGDRVMVVKNDYDKMVFNGDLGKIVSINHKSDEVQVKIFGWFDQDASIPKYIDKVISFTVEEARILLKVAYACTTHKCQGQEFDYVIMPMSSQFGIMLYKNLVYTSITRAKRKVFMFGNPEAFLSAVNNSRDTKRNSNLNALISDHLKIEYADSVMNG
jgi:exodeoxyribonuclease V alpha subunit